MQTFISYFINLTFLSGATLLLYRSLSYGVLRKLFFPLLFLKLSAGITLGLIYYYFYNGGDTVTYFDLADKLSSRSLQGFIQSIIEPIPSSEPVRAIIFTRALAVLLFLTEADYWVASLYFSLVSFTATTFLIVKISKQYQELLWPSVISLAVVPSIVFWSSGILKESLSWSALCFSAGVLIEYLNGEKVKPHHGILAIISVLILVVFKYYIAAVFLPLVTYLWLDKIIEHKGWVQGFWKRLGLIGPALFFPVYFLLGELNPNLTLDAVIGLISFRVDGPEWMSYLTLPCALLTGLVRPVFPEDLYFPAVLSGIENLILIVMIGWKVLSQPMPFGKPTALSFALISYVLLTALFLTLTVSNLGTLVRLKVYFLPWVWLWVLIGHPLWKFFPRTKNC